MLKNLTIDRTIIIIAFLSLFAMALRVPVDTDTWWHIRSGEHTLREGFIQQDPFSHTYADADWINHSWGAQLILYATWRIGGDVGLALYTALLAVGGMAMLYPICTGNNYIRSFALVLGAATAAVFWSARPQMFSFFFSTVVLYLVYSAKQGHTPRFWLLLPLMWLWGNLHAGYSIGYLFLFAFIVGEGFNMGLATDDQRLSPRAWRQLLLFGLLSIPLLMLSPYTYQTLLVPFDTVSIDELRAFIQEWNSPNFQGRETYPFIAQVMLLFGLLWASRRDFDWSSFFLLIGTLFLALSYARNIAVFAVVATPILTQHADDVIDRLNLTIKTRTVVAPRVGRRNGLLIGAVASVVLIYAGSILAPATREPAQAQVLPVAAAQYLNDNDLPTQMFNSYNWGGYLMFTAPDYPVFIDGRTDLYGSFLQVYLDTTLARDGWRDVFAEYDIGLVVVENGVALDSALRDEAGWSLVYEDDLAVIHTREEAQADETN